jgi:hypothetical protein
MVFQSVSRPESVFYIHSCSASNLDNSIPDPGQLAKPVAPHLVKKCMGKGPAVLVAVKVDALD